MKILGLYLLSAIIIILAATDLQAGPLRRLLHRQHGHGVSAGRSCAGGSCGAAQKAHNR